MQVHFLVMFSLDPYQDSDYVEMAVFENCFQYNLLCFHFFLIELLLCRSLVRTVLFLRWVPQAAIHLLLVIWSYKRVLVFPDVRFSFFKCYLSLAIWHTWTGKTAVFYFLDFHLISWFLMSFSFLSHSPDQHWLNLCLVSVEIFNLVSSWSKALPGVRSFAGLLETVSLSFQMHLE